MPPDEISENARTANPGYAAFQIAKALTTAESHEDEATRERSREKVTKWASVLERMISDKLSVGSRQPMRDIPVWATPEVVTGGFVTGDLLAGGPFHKHEEELAARLGIVSATADRRALNAYFLSEAGLAELTRTLHSGCYEIQVPEEGALLVVAWLLENGHSEAARNLIDTIAPYFGRLRFYPRPTNQPLHFGSRIFVESVGSTLQKFRQLTPHSQVMAQREAIQVWAPLYDRMIALFLETVEGEWPTIQPDENGRWVSPETRKFATVGGWPCKRYPEGWMNTALQILAEYGRQRASHRRCGKPEKQGRSFAQLLGYLKQITVQPDSLTGRDVGKIRLILARHIAKHGGPGSEKLARLRELQSKQASAPTSFEIAYVVRERLQAYPPEHGLDVVEPLVQPVTDEEATRGNVPAGVEIPESVRRKVNRALCETADVLVERGIITSGETLARVIPRYTGELRAAAFEDARLRRLYSSVYRAFRQRRSLLLLNLESQVRIEELPWVAATEGFRRKDIAARETSRQALKELSILALRFFPEAILPNKLLQEFRALAKEAELNLPLVDELAADIFMDDFSPKFTEAAKRAAELLERSLYARYYGIDCPAIRQLGDSAAPAKKGWFRKIIPARSNPLVYLCKARANVDSTTSWDVARNGMILEQVQILTTHNLAILFGEFGLAEELRTELRDMAERCFRWICQRLQITADNYHARLIALKNSAYAWRQMIFFLSYLSLDEVESFLGWADGHLREQSEAFRKRFAPALEGLKAAHAGGSLEAPKVQAEGVRCFLGWTKTRHWLLEKVET